MLFGATHDTFAALQQWDNDNYQNGVCFQLNRQALESKTKPWDETFRSWGKL